MTLKWQSALALNALFTFTSMTFAAQLRPVYNEMNKRTAQQFNIFEEGPNLWSANNQKFALRLVKSRFGELGLLNELNDKVLTIARESAFELDAIVLSKIQLADVRNLVAIGVGTSVYVINLHDFEIMAKIQSEVSVTQAQILTTGLPARLSLRSEKLF